MESENIEQNISQNILELSQDDIAEINEIKNTILRNNLLSEEENQKN